jgi:hypothetical protein
MNDPHKNDKDRAVWGNLTLGAVKMSSPQMTNRRRPSLEVDGQEFVAVSYQPYQLVKLIPSFPFSINQGLAKWFF